MAMKWRAVTCFVALVAIAMLMAAPFLSVCEARTTSNDYSNAYNKAYSAFYKEGKKSGYKDAKAGQDNDAVYWASEATYICYTGDTGLTGEKLRGTCDGAMLGTYSGYNDGYKAGGGRTETEESQRAIR